MEHWPTEWNHSQSASQTGQANAGWASGTVDNRRLL